jgi:hypothetical protein
MSFGIAETGIGPRRARVLCLSIRLIRSIRLARLARIFLFRLPDPIRPPGFQFLVKFQASWAQFVLTATTEGLFYLHEREVVP